MDVTKRRRFIEVARENDQKILPYLVQLDGMVRDSLFSSTLHFDPLPLPLQTPATNMLAPHRTHVKVVQSDTFNLAETLVLAGQCNLTVLNMCNPHVPGGGYLDGAGGQEEALCRRSNLSLTLRCRRGLYPIPRYGGIFSPDVLVFRTADDDNCTLLERPSSWWTTVISFPAVVRPPLTPDRKDYANDGDRLLMAEKIRSILRIAGAERRTKLILGAFGCGVFMNPPEQVANLFREVFQEREFKYRFSDIWFPILERGGSSNYEIFHRVLDGMEF